MIPKFVRKKFAGVRDLRTLLAADPALEPGDRLQLALELAADRRPAEARAELDRVWHEADADALRQLPPELLRLLLDLTREWRATARVPADRLAFATALLDAAELLNGKMREIRDSGKIVGLDRIAVMAALNLAHELLKSQTKDRRGEAEAGTRVRALRERIDGALKRSRQLDI